MAIMHRRPITCYDCGRLLGYVEVSMGPEGMAQFRRKAEELKRQHRCGEAVGPGANGQKEKP